MESSKAYWIKLIEDYIFPKEFDNHIPLRIPKGTLVRIRCGE